MKHEFKITEVFDKEKPNIETIIQDIFKSYVKEKINIEKDLNYKK